MALNLGELVAILKADNRPLEKGLDAGRRKARDTGKAMQGDATVAAAAVAREWGRGGAASGDSFTHDATSRLRDARGRFATAGEQLGQATAEGLTREWSRTAGTTADAFTRDVNGRMRDAKGRFVTTGSDLGGDTADGIGRGLRGGFGTIASAIGSLTGMLGNLGGPLVQAVAWIAGIGAAAAGSATLIGVLGGALGSLPGLIGGLGAITGVLSLGFMGLGDAFKKTAGGGAGGAMVDRAYQIAQAERRLRDANEQVTESQEAVTRARVKATAAQEDLLRAEKRAAENLQDLNRDLSGAKLDQEEAALRVTEAELAYQEALRKPWEPRAIVRAELALRQAKHAAEESKDRVEDLGEEHADAAKKGIKGSDEVKAAQERHQEAVDQVTAAVKRQRSAVEGVTDAEHALAQARKGSGGGGGGGAGQEITKLAPAAAAAVRAIKALKPAFEALRLHVQEKLFAGVGARITKVADAWKTTLHQRLGSMATMLNGLFHNFGKSVSKPQFISDMSAGLGSFEKMVGRIGEAITGPFMDAWGRLSRAAGPFLEKLGTVFGRALEKFSAWIAEADKSGKLTAFFESSANTMEKIWTVGEDILIVLGKFMAIIFPQATNAGDTVLDGVHVTLTKISAWLDRPENQQKIRDIISSVKDLVMWFGRVSDKVGGFYNSAKSAYDRIKTGGNQLVSWISGLPGRISNASRSMWDGIKNAFRGAINWVISRWNGLSFGIPGGSFMGMSWPGMTMRTPDIPYLAQGGIVPATPGGRLAVIGEGGQDEAVLPLSKLRDMFGRTVLELRSSGSALDDVLVEALRSAIKWRGGNVQVVLGQGG